MLALSMVDYIHDLKQAGVTDQQSEVHARHLLQVVANVKSETQESMRKELQFDLLATKDDVELTKKEIELAKKELDLSIAKVRSDLEISIEKVRYDMLKFVIWTGITVLVTMVSGFGALAGMIAKGFHWF